MGRFLLGCLILALVAGTVLTSVTLVRSDELAVVRRFGRILPENAKPGLLFGLPWGMDQVNRVSLKDLSITVGWTDAEVDENNNALTPGQLLTGDHNLVNVQAVVEYRVIADQVDKYVLMEPRVKSLIARAADAAMAEWLAGQKIDDAILKGKTELESFLQSRVSVWIRPYDLGVNIERASIVMIYPPNAVRESFNAVGQANTRMETEMNNALQYKELKAKKAAEKIYAIERETGAYVREQRRAAQADADNFLVRLAEYRLLSKENPRHLNNLWLDEVTRIYAQLRRSGRLDVLDNYIGSDGINITQFPLQKKR